MHCRYRYLDGFAHEETSGTKDDTIPTEDIFICPMVPLAA